MKRHILFAVLGSGSLLSEASALHLADVMHSLQERKQALEQRKQVFEYLKTEAFYTPTIPTQILIDWKHELDAWPTQENLDALTLGERIGLLNQAVREFHSISRYYLNVDFVPEPGGQGVAVGQKIGELRPFLREDFPELGLADQDNYHEVLYRLATYILRLETLPWTHRALMVKKTLGYFYSSSGEDPPSGYEEVSSPGEDETPNTEFNGYGLGSSESWAISEYGKSSENGQYPRATSWATLNGTWDIGPGPDDERIDVAKTVVYQSSVVLTDAIPNVSGQFNGDVVVLTRNDWTAAQHPDPTSSGTGGYTAPAEWDPLDGSFLVEAVGSGGILTDAKPSTGNNTTDDETWVDLASGSVPVVNFINAEWAQVEVDNTDPIGPIYRNHIFVKGFDLQKAYETTKNGPNPNTDFLRSYERFEHNPNANPFMRHHLSRESVAAFVPQFIKGLNNNGANVPARSLAQALEGAGAVRSRPAGDGEVALHPAPGMLFGIHLGAGFDSGDVTGWLGISPGNRMFAKIDEAQYAQAGGNILPQPLSSSGVLGFNVPLLGGSNNFIRFDYSSNLRFIGPATDFHVVYETSREPTSGLRGADLPDLYPDPGDQANVNDLSSDFIRAWDLSRIRQVVSRDLIVDITCNGHYSNIVKVYRRDTNAAPVNRIPGQLVAVDETNLIRTLLITNPDATTAYPGTAVDPAEEKLEITDGDKVYEIGRNALLASDDEDNLTFSLRAAGGGGGSVYSKVVARGAYAGGAVDPAYEVTISESVDGAELSTSKVASDLTHWWGTLTHKMFEPGPSPSNSYIGSVSYPAPNARTVNWTGFGLPGILYPLSYTIDYPDQPDAYFEWSTNGLIITRRVGQWQMTIQGGGPPAGGGVGSPLTYEYTFNGNRIGTVWQEWSNVDKTVKTYTAPNGQVGSMGHSHTDWSEIRYGDASGAISQSGLPGLPHRGSNKDGSGSVYEWTAPGDGSAVATVSHGRLSGDAVTSGSRSRTSKNARGYVTDVESFFLQSGTELKVAGRSTPAGQGNTTDWGAPLKAADYTTGRETSWAYDGQLERIATATDPLGKITAATTRDLLGRVTAFTWNNAAGTRSYLPGLRGVDGSLNLSGRPLSSHYETDGSGRPIQTSATVGGITDVVEAVYSGAEVQVDRSSGLLGTKVRTLIEKEGGTITSIDDAPDATAGAIPFGGTNGDGGYSVTPDGLLQSGASIAGLPSAFQRTCTDFWGRLCVVESPGTAPAGGVDSTSVAFGEVGLSNPPGSGSPINRAKTHHASGRRTIQETEPWSSAGHITRSGVDVDKNDELLWADDRFVESCTSIEGGKIKTVISVSDEPASREVLKVLTDPSNGQVTITTNVDEEVITRTPNYGANTVQTTWARGGTVYRSETVTFNNLGAPELTQLSGAGMPELTLDPTFRADGSVSGASLKVGTATYGVAFDDAGRLTSVTDPLLGELLDAPQSFAGGKETLSLKGQTYTRSFDGTATTASGPDLVEHGRSVEATGGGFIETLDPDTGSSTRQVFSAAGVKTKHDYDVGSDPAATYRAGGLLDYYTIGRGGNVAMGYSEDGAMDLTSITWPPVSSGSFGTLNTVPGGYTYAYDRAGRVDEVTDTSGTRDLSYVKGRLDVVDWRAGSALDPYTVDRNYDSHGRLQSVSVSYSGTEIHSYTIGRPDVSGEVADVSASEFRAVFGRDSDRHVTSIARGPVVQSWERGVAGRIEAASHTVDGFTGAPSFDYTPFNDPDASFDDQGRRLHCRTEGATWRYTYGIAGALASAAHPVLGNFSYQFDGIGRRLDFDSDPAVSNGTDPLNQFGGIVGVPQKSLLINADPGALLWVDDVEKTPFTGSYTHPLTSPGAAGGWTPWSVRAVLEGQGDPGAAPDAVATQAGRVWFPPTTGTINYDGDGNRQDGAGWDYGWDSRNRLVRARTSDYATADAGWDLSFDYDSEGRRFKKEIKRKTTVDQVTTEVTTTVTFVWDGWDLLYERHEDGAGVVLERKYVWGLDISGSHGGAGGAGGLMLVRETSGGGTTDYYPVYDGGGHVVALLDEAGTQVAKYTWGPFGEQIEATGPLADANPWRYATKYYDVETGLYYFGYRYYDPVTGQWLSREPLGEDESLNLYAYCHNDPINKVDVLGLAAFLYTPSMTDEEVIRYWKRRMLSAYSERDQLSLDARLEALGLKEAVDGAYHEGHVVEFQRALLKFAIEDAESKSSFPRASAIDGATAKQSLIDYRWQELMESTAEHRRYMNSIVTVGSNIQFSAPDSIAAAQGFFYTLFAASPEFALLGSGVNATTRTLGVGRLMLSGQNLNRARLIYGLRAGLQNGPMIAKAGSQFWAAPIVRTFLQSPQFAALPPKVRAVAAPGTGVITNKFPNEALPTDGKIFGQASISNGKISLSGRQLPRDVDFVVTTDGRLILGRRHHLLGDRGDVLAAGQMKLNGRGAVRQVDNLSGHYRPTLKEAEAFPDIFRSLGIDLSHTRLHLYDIQVNSSGMITNPHLVPAVNKVLR